MLRALSLEGFKAFKEPARFELAPITVLAGKNSSGKSSVTGALGALIQTEEAPARLGPGLVTGGAWARLGRAVEIPNKSRAGEDARRFALALEWDIEGSKEVGLPQQAMARIEYACSDSAERAYLASLDNAQISFEHEGIKSVDQITVEDNNYKLQIDNGADGPVNIRLSGNLHIPSENAFGLDQIMMFLGSSWRDVFKDILRTEILLEFATKMQNDLPAYLDSIKAYIDSQKEPPTQESINQYMKQRAEGLFTGEAPSKTRGTNDRRLLPMFLMASLRGVLAPSRFQSLSAYRIPPMEFYAPHPGQGPRVGLWGEHLGQALFDLRTLESDLAVLSGSGPAPGGSTNALQVLNRWWQHLFGIEGLRAGVAELGRIGYEVSVATGVVEDLKLYQVGTGLSQTLPILASVVLSKPDDMLIMDTPEAHLHPAAQHRITELFVAAAKQKRRFVLETHSDQIVNRLCLAVKKKELGPEDVKIYFISQEGDSSYAEEVAVDENGRVRNWPKGFLDQSGQDLAALLEP